MQKKTILNCKRKIEKKRPWVGTVPFKKKTWRNSSNNVFFTKVGIRKAPFFAVALVAMMVTLAFKRLEKAIVDAVA